MNDLTKKLWEDADSQSLMQQHHDAVRKHKSQSPGGNMNFLNPDVAGADGNLTDTFPEGEPFTVKKAEVITGVQTDYGEGEMVVVTVETPDGDKRLSIWGAYLCEQARSAQASDFPMRVKVARGPVEGYSQRPDTKQFVSA